MYVRYLDDSKFNMGVYKIVSSSPKYRSVRKNGIYARNLYLSRYFYLYYNGHFDVHRTFATETTQFLAPYEASVKPRSDDTTPPELPSDIRPCIATSASHVRVVSTRSAPFLFLFLLKSLEKMNHFIILILLFH